MRARPAKHDDASRDERCGREIEEGREIQSRQCEFVDSRGFGGRQRFYCRREYGRQEPGTRYFKDSM